MNEINVIDLSQRIDIISTKRSLGKACVANSRIAVNDIIGMLDDGMSSEAICNYFPVLTEDDILACIAYEAKRG